MTTMEILSINNHVSQSLNEALISGQDKTGELKVG